MPPSKKTKTAMAGSLIAAAGLAVALPGAAMAAPENLPDLVEEISDAVVSVEVSVQISPAQGRGRMQNDEFFEEFRRRFGDRMPQMPDGPGERLRNGVGSGFVISEEGLVVTNHHVIDDAESVTVTFNDGTSYEATVVGADPLTDIALLDIEGEDHPVVAFGSSEAMRVGDDVVAMGNPFGLGSTVTTGIVSAKDRNLGSGGLNAFIQTDAAINRGNSGGPLFNEAGEVIGVNTAIISPTGGSAGIGFAVPSDLVEEIVADLEADGQIDRGWLGVQIRPVSEEVANVLGLEAGFGVMVEAVIAEAPAAEAGIAQGDIVLKFNGTAIEMARDLTRAVSRTAPGSDATVTVLRKGEELVLDVTLANRAENDA